MFTLVGETERKPFRQGSEVALSSDEQHAFAVTYDELVVVDISDRTNPVIVGNLFPAVATLKGITLSPDDRYAYVIAGTSGVFVFDVGDKANPSLVGRYDHPAVGNTGQALAIALSDDGSKAFVAFGTNGLHVVDVTNPADPFLISSLELGASSSGVSEVVMANDGTTLFVGAGELYTVDVGNITNPTVLGQLDTFGEVASIAPSADGDVVFVVCQSWGQRIEEIDVTDRQVPVLLASSDPIGGAKTLWPAIGSGYVFQQLGTLLGINVLLPKSTGELEPVGGGEFIAYAGVVGRNSDFIFVTTRSDGMRVYEIDLAAGNRPPTIDSIPDVTVTEGQGEITIPLSGISAGAYESQAISVTARLDDEVLIASVAVDVDIAAGVGVLRLTPEAGAHGKTTVTVAVADGGRDGLLATGVDNAVTSVSFELTVTPTNEPPTAIEFIRPVTDVDENSNTSSRMYVSGVVVQDDGAGKNVVSLTGADASRFEIVGSDLYLRPNVALDYETQSSYSVTVEASDPSVPGSTPVTADFVLTVADVNEAPTAVTLTDAVTSLPEDTDNATRVKVATISVADDALGTNMLSLNGADADFFEIDGAELFLRAGVDLDYDVKLSYSVTVEAYDSSVAGSVAVAAEYVLQLSYVEEPPFGSVMTFTSEGLWLLSRRSDGAMATTTFAAWSSSVDWGNLLVGDFNGDGLADVVGQNLANGTWYASINQGDGTGSTRYMGIWAPRANWRDVTVGDFNGDGIDDVVGRASSGAWYAAMGRADGIAFTNRFLTAWNPRAAWGTVRVGDFNGDGSADLAGRLTNNGQWWVAFTSPFAPAVNQLVGRWSPLVNWEDVIVGDFNGDGADDLVGRTSNSGAWYAALGSTAAASFPNQFLGAWNPSIDWRFVGVVDINGDGRSDLLGQLNLPGNPNSTANGQWWAGQMRSDTVRFANVLWGKWSQADWQQVSLGDFDDDGRMDLLGHRSSSDPSEANQWTLSRNDGQSLVNAAFGYFGRDAAGDSIGGGGDIVRTFAITKARA